MELKKIKHSPSWQMIMMIMMKLYNRFILVHITISTVKFCTKQKTNADGTHSALNNAFLYRAMFGAFVLFGCWD